MPFVEQEEHFEDHIIDGKPVKVYKLWLVCRLLRGLQSVLLALQMALSVLSVNF